jgi:DNA-binding FadR family transcriptional regulator
MGSAAADGRTPSRKAKAAEITARRIVDRIVGEGLREGDPLPNEAAMLRDLAVGRPTLREALRLLETQGVLSIRPGPGGGPVVRRPDPGDLAGTMTLLLETLQATMDEALTAWAAVEPVVARLAAENATDAQVAALDERVRRMRAAAADPAFYAENAAFHRLLAEAAGNTVLLITLETIARVTAAITSAIHLPRAFRSTLIRHAQRLAAALGARDAVAAAGAATGMMDDWRDFIAARYPAMLAERIRWSPDGSAR